MEHPRLVSPGSFCWNPDCPDYGKVDHGNIIKFGRTNKGTQRYQCKTCRKTHVETKGTVFYGRHHSQETIMECLAWLAERNSLAAIRRVKGIKEDTVLDDGQRRWRPRSPAMVAGLTDHIWTVKELLTTVVAPSANNMI